MLRALFGSRVGNKGLKTWDKRSLGVAGGFQPVHGFLKPSGEFIQLKKKGGGGGRATDGI